MILIPSSNPLPYLRVEDFFTDVQLNQLILPEIEYLSKSTKMRSAEDTGSARDREGNITKKNSGVFIEELYRDSSMSEISTVLKQFWNTKVCGAIESVGPWNRSFRQCNTTATLLSYYQDGDYYLPHIDDCHYTLLIWLWKEPRQFEGGTFIFNDTKEKLPMKNNSAVLFPSCYSHEVKKVTMKDLSPFNGMGRYTISRFYWITQNSGDMCTFNGSHPIEVPDGVNIV